MSDLVQKNFEKIVGIQLIILDNECTTYCINRPDHGLRPPPSQSSVKIQKNHGFLNFYTYLNTIPK